MPEVIRRAALLYGDDDYIVMPDRRISFREVEAASRHLAKRLLAAGVTKGTRVGIHLATGPEWVVAFSAVTRVGALAMPFSTLFRPAELRTALRIGDVAVLLSSPRMLRKDHETFLEEAIPGLATSVPGHLRVPDVPYLRSIWLLGGGSRDWATRFDVCRQTADDPADGVDDTLLEAVEAEVTPADPFVVVFTSGTTADPKGVLHSHGAVLRKLAPEADAALNAMFGGRVLSLMPFFWIGGLQEVLAAPQSGAALLVLERLDVAAALELGKREQATSIRGNPQALQSLLGGGDLASAIPTIRPLPARRWDGGPSSKGDVPTAIGMTETVGPWTAVDGFDARVVDPDSGETLSEGEVGEFLVRGYGLMQGLYKREREEVFTPDGFYATGDLGYAENGLSHFKSRLKDMIKTKGANVAPAEVEAVLNASPHVRFSFVVGLPHEAFGEEVAAAVVPDRGASVDLSDLEAECRRLLSPYKVPTIIEVLRADEVPQLSSGKPDRRGVARMLDDRRAARRG
jgi:acyl-CoA synthetase (AMP-forming)/AMP-acid ligase II